MTSRVPSVEATPLEERLGQFLGGALQEGQHLELVTTIGILLALGERHEEGLTEYLTLIRLNPQLGCTHGATVVLRSA